MHYTKANDFSAQRVVGSTLTTSGYADSGPMIKNLSGATQRVREINDRIAKILSSTGQLEATMFGPSPETSEPKGGAVCAPNGQLAELHEVVGYAEGLLATLEASVSRLHSI